MKIPTFNARFNKFVMEKFAEISGKKIFYRISGNGPVLMLVHGFTESMDIWVDFAQQLSKDFTVITPDLPGHGLSECIDSVHSMELMALCLKTILEAEGVKQSVIIGHSMGGYAALAFAENYPEMISGLGLFHSTVYADTRETKQNRARTNEVIRQNHFHFLSEFIPSLFAPDNRKKFKAEIDSMRKKSEQMSAEAIIAANSGMAQRPDRSHVISNGCYPVLIIAGKLDSRVPFARALNIAALPKQCYALFLGDIGHMGYLEARNATLKAVKHFTGDCFS